MYGMVLGPGDLRILEGKDRYYLCVVDAFSHYVWLSKGVTLRDGRKEANRARLASLFWELCSSGECPSFLHVVTPPFDSTPNLQIRGVSIKWLDSLPSVRQFLTNRLEEAIPDPFLPAAMTRPPLDLEMQARVMAVNHRVEESLHPMQVHRQVRTYRDGMGMQRVRHI
jgi:hypothetical protein